MEKFYRTLLLTLCSFSFPGAAQPTLGVGVVSINVNEKSVILFYDSRHEVARTLAFYYDSANFSPGIRDLQAINHWFFPESKWLEISVFHLRCKSRSDGWLEVVVNNKDGETMFIPETSDIRFISWETYLRGMSGITRTQNHPQKLRVEASDDSKEITRFQTGNDCFSIKTMKGDWIEVYENGLCDPDTPKISSAWLRWRDKQSLLIGYYISL